MLLVRRLSCKSINFVLNCFVFLYNEYKEKDKSNNGGIIMYTKGQSKEETFIILNGDNLEQKYDFDIKWLNLDEDINKLKSYNNLLVWCGRLIVNARLLDDCLDILFSEAITIKDHIFSSKKNLKNLLSKLIELREPVRNLEIDIEEFIRTASIDPLSYNAAMSNSVYQVLTQVNRAYDRVYGITISKINNRSNSWVTAASILLSIIALGLSLYAISNNIG